MKNKKKILIIIIVAIIIFVALVLIRNAITKKQFETRPLNSYEDLQNAQDVMRYVGGEYLGEKESSDENFSKDIYVKFSKDLYTGENSNEDYYKNVVTVMAYTLKFDSFRIADEEKKILISVVCNKEESSIERTYINGYDNYYARQNSGNNYEKMVNNNTKITNFNIQSIELMQLMNNDWRKNALKLNNAEEFNGSIYAEEIGIEVKIAYKNVLNIVFEENYNGNILNNINTKMKLSEIKSILGNPTFESTEEANFIGYKGKNIYVFFSEGQVSIYPINDYNISTFENLIRQFNEDKNVKKFVSSTTSTWQDYNLYNYDENFVNLEYVLKGIKIQFNVTNQHGVIVYNNCKYISEIKKLKDEIGIEEIYFINEDAVYLRELERLTTNIRG